MTDLLFDTLANDLVLRSGSFDEIERSSLQNAALIFNKSVTSILQPQFGLGFEEFYANLPAWLFGRVQVAGERLLKRDGALIARITIQDENGWGVYPAKIDALYRGE